MKPVQHTINAFIRHGENSGYVAECVEIAVITQGSTLDEVTRNLQEAVGLHLEGEDLADLGLVKTPTVVVSMELEPTYA
ncbi:MAG TPA: type II toxin-antitoxin system HicB family antitoxin [Verrucomicrobiales bacterium]|nr:type II toxin-antitoxin system HicB family antitoxin [Verrucomicrobiales bacterium]